MIYIPHLQVGDSFQSLNTKVHTKANVFKKNAFEASSMYVGPVVGQSARGKRTKILTEKMQNKDDVSIQMCQKTQKIGTSLLR